jgi:gliding motility-associated-like protein
MVYNQWGQKVFETSDYNTGWDGTFNGKPQPVGVYVYVASIRLSDGRNITKKGSFNLIR